MKSIEFNKAETAVWDEESSGKGKCNLVLGPYWAVFKKTRNHKIEMIHSVLKCLQWFWRGVRNIFIAETKVGLTKGWRIVLDEHHKYNPFDATLEKRNLNGGESRCTAWPCFFILNRTLATRQSFSFGYESVYRTK